MKILTTDATGSYPIYYQNEKTRMVVAVQISGQAWEKFECERDLVNVSIKLVGWVNIQKSVFDPGFAMIAYATEAAAREYSNDPDYIETRKIEIEVP